ncbi:EAL domain-containing protein [Legionella taurinensis]|uniref:EAL domain-containing protein n=1 Tax=Legionella taurinensis TaxID=70611 RepID=A0A3A5LE00_9GAMM|nr:EAL domain-containing protein [Legionella taurinensis]MDX1836126.1 EAL domain-containing protein [Legionella taurinensis]PUT42101.1 EAL domain-containing protein [Legionella taurinensis]PUT44888.1 EAL domain-containing protein [Legionella taurinensis]PUT48209.1 EAL domain-containing protein [Legionella taurinensis]PUT49023.1 EAL domain-containing protein [Legionella taurinensis]
MPCQKCDSTATYQLSGNYQLLVSPPRGHCYSKLINHLTQCHYKFSTREGGIIELFFSSEEAKDLGHALECCFSQAELEDSKAVLMPMDAPDRCIERVLNHTHSLKKVVGLCLSQWLVELITNKGLTTFCQPILHSDTLKPYGFECLLRGKQGDTAIVSPADLFGAAKSSELLFLLDKNARICHIENMSKIDISEKKLFINFNPTAIYDPLFCLTTTNQSLKKTGIRPSQIVFEVTESDEVKDKKHLLKIIDYYRNQGYGVALDDLGSGYSSLNLLTELQPDYIKLDYELVHQIHTNEFKQIILEKIGEMATKLRIKMICEGIESDDELQIIKQYSIDFYQGFLFAKPMPYEHIPDYIQTIDG